jgi:broad specificity phosphatase PhoE
MSPPTRLYLIRHGEVEARFQRIFGGRIGMELSPHGVSQARAPADYPRTTHLLNFTPWCEQP